MARHWPLLLSLQCLWLAAAVRPNARDEELEQVAMHEDSSHRHKQQHRYAQVLHVTDECEKDLKAPADPTEACPKNCPFSAEINDPKEYCHFKCVKPQECGTEGTIPNQTIPEREKTKENPYCRYCEVEACAQCISSKPGVEDEAVEKCQKCMLGYTLSEDGKECTSHGDDIFLVLAAIGAVAGLLGAGWYVSLAMKPTVNVEGLQYAQSSHMRMMITQDHHGDEGQPYPFGTNLMSKTVAGPGATALFRFQGAVLLWGLLVLCLWFAFVLFVSKDLLILGNRPAATPRQLCEVVFWGRHRQMELIWTKCTWIVCAYLLGTIGAVAYGIMMAKFFVSFDSERATLSDYVAVLEGVPTITGEEPAEALLKEAVQKAIGEDVAKDVIAVSVGWNFSEHVPQVRHFIDEEVAEFHVEHGEPKETPEGSGEEFNGACGAISKQVLEKWHIHLDGHGHEFEVEDLKNNLKSLETAPTSYVIFMKEDSRDKAIEAVKDTGIKIKDATCSLRAETYEPEALFWHNLHITPAQRSGRFVGASVQIFLVCMAWTVVLYLPYAHYMAAFSYANGDEPSPVAESVFVGLVVGAQVGLFVASSIGADKCKCHYEDQKHRVYIIFYNAALILNLVMDIALQGYLSYLQMVGVGARVADGRLLGSLQSFQEIFESFPMQKSVGKLLFKYCWPCTFLVPFAVEPFLAQLGPYQVGSMLIRSNARVRGENAERALELSEMEQGRYADIIFNLILVACIPFIAPAYMAWTYGTFMVSHLYIYWYDHWKTLRWARKFYFSSDEVHWFGQQLLCLPLGVLAASAVFKINQWSGGVTGGLGSGVLKGATLWGAMAAAFTLHVSVHLALLTFVVKPMRSDPDKAPNEMPFSKVAEEEAATHLSTNPIQCLRSKYILGDSPPLSPFVLGKEKVMKANPKLGAFFDGEVDAAQKAKFREERRSRLSQAKEEAEKAPDA
mmetsp:Transcript_94265/g.224431  ORF Transcript_94265/g.224431 Transcript_94265/m.224431 type:complete len:955 (+) Transcript_94265:115-2979(+)|eukprot:CAMPEP_0181537196 /NCGR_PEP_ID=MMETSP1110-20121109/75221_1 /TAXON_ID=174948 /ORGANISM="Symbiodinium sp., Strain CCMP421" /LENGTH=954 /DNA_ID=CAMNT_0023668749 /DNA_START=24 /DNA_END=2888 /DNA_ORIENTATION=-